MQQRYYDPTAGRFLSIDPVGPMVGDPRTINRYSYAWNSPYRYNDPTGEVPLDTTFDAASIGYDIVKIGFGYFTGNPQLVTDGVIDLGTDTAAFFIPYVPAGSSKIARALNKNVEVPRSVSTQFEAKIEKQMSRRGWDKDSIVSTIDNPGRTVPTRDTRWKSDGTRRDDPATAYIRDDGQYVVRNDNDGTIVQLSDRNKEDWKSPFE